MTARRAPIRPFYATFMTEASPPPALGRYDRDLQVTVGKSGEPVVFADLPETFTKASKDPSDTSSFSAFVETTTKVRLDPGDQPMSWVDTGTRAQTDPETHLTSTSQPPS